MIERLPIVAEHEQIDTENEPWDDGKNHWYVAAARFAVDNLGHGGARRKCLVIGSPLDEVRLLAGNGWRCTHLDWREHPSTNIVGDATNMGMIQGESFEAVSSTCVLCHAGLGRYGDPVKENGDALMMAEIARVLKPGGAAVLMVGPTLPLKSVALIYGNVHRFYTLAAVMDMAKSAGLEFVDGAVWYKGEWVDADEFEALKADIPDDATGVTVAYGYLSVVLRKRT